MLNFLIKNRNGQFLLVGICMTLLGFVLILVNDFYSSLAFYVAIYFLGFYAAKNAVVDTFQSKSLNVDLLMILAAIGAVIINFESEGAILLLIFAGAEVLEDYASNKSTRAISELMSQVPLVANVLADNGDVIQVATDDLKLGDIVIVSKGAQIPIDGITDRRARINEATLTGESLPVEKEAKDKVFAGTINDGHVFYLTVTTLSNQTVFSNIIRMVEEAQNRPSKVAKFIDRIESKYVLIVLISVPIFIFILYYFSGLHFANAFYRGMVLLTVASPCALVASATPATLSAISNGAKNGVLFKGGAAMEALSSMNVLYSDKTGTLTHGEFIVVEYELAEEILKDVVYMEQQSSHPIADAIVSSFADLNLDSVNQNDDVEEIAGFGLKKGKLTVGKPSAFDLFEDTYQYRKKITTGMTTVFVGKDNEIVGYFTLSDQIRSEAAEAVACFHSEGINITLITGDNESVANKVAKEVYIDNYYANCSPEDKINYVQDHQLAGDVVGMIGDGINDAPALAHADIGIAMGSGSSVAMESSDVVIVENNLMKLYDSFKLSQKLNRIIIQNVIFSMSIIILLVVLNVFGLLGLPLGVVFHEGSTILVILNGLRLLRQNIATTP